MSRSPLFCFYIWSSFVVVSSVFFASISDRILIMLEAAYWKRQSEAQEIPTPRIPGSIETVAAALVVNSKFNVIFSFTLFLTKKILDKKSYGDLPQ